MFLVCTQNYKELELLRLVYYGGVEHQIRKEVWPFLLGHYKFGMEKKDMTQVKLSPGVCEDCSSVSSIVCCVFRWMRRC